MPNPENLKPKPFTSENQPANRGRKKGVKNRATILEKYLKGKIKFPNKNARTGEKIFESLDEDIVIPVQDRVMLALIAEALKGNINAIREIQDTVYGKMPNVNELTGADGGAMEVNHHISFVDDLLKNYGQGDATTDRD